MSWREGGVFEVTQGGGLSGENATLRTAGCSGQYQCGDYLLFGDGSKTNRTGQLIPERYSLVITKAWRGPTYVISPYAGTQLELEHGKERVFRFALAKISKLVGLTFCFLWR